MSQLSIPFPTGLMSTARAPVAMPTTYARELVNILAGADGAGVKRCGLTPFGVALPAGEVLVGLFPYQSSVGVLQVLGVVASGKIYCLEAGVWRLLHEGWNPQGVPRGVVFAGKLVLCNGLDDLLMWDGGSLLPVEEMVTEASDSLVYLSPTVFQVDSDAGFYQVGRKVEVTLSTGVVASTIASVLESGAHVFVTLTDAVLDSTLHKVAYAARPPRFAMLVAAHDRLWGFGRGRIALTLSADPDRCTVFYTFGVNDAVAWHNAEGIVPFMNIAGKSAGQDEILAMSVRDGLTLFILRSSLQLWTGTDPTETGDMAWSKTLPLGVVHGSLVVELPNDLAFVTRFGVRTLSKVVQGEDLVVSDVGSELDPTISTLVGRMVDDGNTYALAKACKCPWQGWFGLQLAGTFVVFQLGAKGHGWTVFEGLPARFSAFAVTPDGQLVMAEGGQVYVYDPHATTDAGVPYTLRWVTPWVAPARGRRWANYYLEVLTDQGAPVPLVVRRLRDLDSRADQVWDGVAAYAPDFWDEALWDVGQWDNGVLPVTQIRDHFVARQVALEVESTSDLGPVTFFGLKLYGVAER